MLTAADVDPKVVARYAWGRYSQNGEDGVLAYLLSLLHDVPKTCYEIGGTLDKDGNPECNTANLLANGWKGKIVDAVAWTHPWFLQHRVVPADVQHYTKNRTAADVGVLSVDVDGIDFYLWQAWEGKPDVVVIEYNSMLPNTEPLVVPYDPNFQWDGSDYFGANAKALIQLAWGRGYQLAATVACLNLVFVKREHFYSGQTSDPHVYPPDWSRFGPVVRHPTDRSGRKYVNPFKDVI